MGAIDALFGNRDISGEFLGDRRSFKAAGLHRLGAAIGLDAGKEQIGARAVDDALNAERSGIGIDMDGVLLAVRGECDGYCGRGRGPSQSFPGCSDLPRFPAR